MKLLAELKTKVKGVVNSLNEDRVMLVPISKLTFDKEFKELFEQEEDKVNRIAANMRENGNKFDKSQPIIINESFNVLDGHSRLMAAKIVGLKAVPVIMKKFSSKEDALEYELHLQLDRRNLTDSQIYAAYKKKASLKKADGSKAKTDLAISKELNVSPRQLAKLKEVEKKADQNTMEAFKSGAISLNGAYKKIKSSQERKEKKNVAPCGKKRTYEQGYADGIRYAVSAFDAGKTSKELLAELNKGEKSK
jgi:ParB family chromosome partitioning protein